MFFDSVEMLTENFFSREVLFIIGLTYVFFEINRLVIILMNFMFKNLDNLKFRIIAQYSVCFVISVVVISIILYQYFVNIEGFSTIQTELITFNSIYLFAAIFYHLYFFSMLFLRKKNYELVSNEIAKKKNLELELTTFKNEINPDFLFEALEVIITELHSNKKNADKLIDQLAQVYRYTLDNRQNDLVPLIQEVKAMKPLMGIFQAKYGNNVKLDVKTSKDDEVNIIPGTLQIFFEHAALNNLISEKLPLDFKIITDNRILWITFDVNQKLTQDSENLQRIHYLKKVYAYYSDRGVEEFVEDGTIKYKIPLLKVEEE